MKRARTLTKKERKVLLRDRRRASEVIAEIRKLPKQRFKPTGVPATFRDPLLPQKFWDLAAEMDETLSIADKKLLTKMAAFGVAYGISEEKLHELIQEKIEEHKTHKKKGKRS